MAIQRVNASTSGSSIISPSSASRLLRTGSKGQAVRELQQALAKDGFNPGPIDGDFGPLTRGAVLAYQRANHLAVDGIVGPQTWGSLRGSSFTRPPRPGPTNPTNPPSGGGGAGWREKVLDEARRHL